MPVTPDIHIPSSISDEMKRIAEVAVELVKRDWSKVRENTIENAVDARDLRLEMIARVEAFGAVIDSESLKSIKKLLDQGWSVDDLKFSRVEASAFGLRLIYRVPNGKLGSIYVNPQKLETSEMNKEEYNKYVEHKARYDSIIKVKRLEKELKECREELERKQETIEWLDKKVDEYRDAVNRTEEEKWKAIHEKDEEIRKLNDKIRVLRRKIAMLLRAIERVGVKEKVAKAMGEIKNEEELEKMYNEYVYPEDEDENLDP